MLLLLVLVHLLLLLLMVMLLVLMLILDIMRHVASARTGIISTTVIPSTTAHRTTGRHWYRGRLHQLQVLAAGHIRRHVRAGWIGRRQVRRDGVTHVPVHIHVRRQIAHVHIVRHGLG